MSSSSGDSDNDNMNYYDYEDEDNNTDDGSDDDFFTKAIAVKSVDIVGMTPQDFIKETDKHNSDSKTSGDSGNKSDSIDRDNNGKTTSLSSLCSTDVTDIGSRCESNTRIVEVNSELDSAENTGTVSGKMGNNFTPDSITTDNNSAENETKPVDLIVARELEVFLRKTNAKANENRDEETILDSDSGNKSNSKDSDNNWKRISISSSLCSTDITEIGPQDMEMGELKPYVDTGEVSGVICNDVTLDSVASDNSDGKMPSVEKTEQNDDIIASSTPEEFLQNASNNIAIESTKNLNQSLPELDGNTNREADNITKAESDSRQSQTYQQDSLHKLEYTIESSDKEQQHTVVDTESPNLNTTYIDHELNLNCIIHENTSEKEAFLDQSEVTTIDISESKRIDLKGASEPEGFSGEATDDGIIAKKSVLNQSQSNQESILYSDSVDSGKEPDSIGPHIADTALIEQVNIKTELNTHLVEHNLDSSGKTDAQSDKIKNEVTLDDGRGGQTTSLYGNPSKEFSKPEDIDKLVRKLIDIFDDIQRKKNNPEITETAIKQVKFEDSNLDPLENTGQVLDNIQNNLAPNASIAESTCGQSSTNKTVVTTSETEQMDLESVSEQEVVLGDTDKEANAEMKDNLHQSNVDSGSESDSVSESVSVDNISKRTLLQSNSEIALTQFKRIKIDSTGSDNTDMEDDVLPLSTKMEISGTEPSKVERNHFILKEILQSFEATIDDDYLTVLDTELVNQIQELPLSDRNYSNIKAKFDTSMMSGTQSVCRGYDVNSIKKVVNPYLLAHFKVRKEKKRDMSMCVYEEELYHGTQKKNLTEICQYNFDWRKCGHHVGTKFGKGVSFAKYQTYATFYPKVQETPRVMIVTNILYVNKQLGRSSMTIPSEGYDTSINPKGEVVVKYDDAEYCPLYLIYYS